jgi:hypothetical protein
MSQNDFNIANQGFPSFRSDLNSALQALASNSSGSTEPATTYANQLWYDDANNLLKMRDEVNANWITLGTLDQVAKTFSAPALTGVGDTNTAIRFPAADTVTVETAGAERLRVDSSGNVGIGTSVPSDYNAAADNLVVGTTSGNNGITIASGSADQGSLFFADGTASGAEEAAGFLAYVHSSNAMIFGTQNAERARIDSGGNLLVGTTSTNLAAGALYLVPGTNAELGIGHGSAAGSGSTFVAFRYNNTSIGSITQNGTTATAYNTSSDYRLKENVQPMQDALAKIAQLNPVTYTWKADGSDGQGFIAHELQAVVPDCVTGEKDAVDEDGNPKYQGVDTSFLVATLVKAVQELSAKVASLEAQLNP